MKEELLQRLEILKQGGILNSDDFKNMELLIKGLEVKGIFSPEKRDQVIMMCTHIAMALSRTDNPVDAMDDESVMEIQSSPVYEEALLLWEEFSFVFDKLHLNEKYYIITNFCNILSCVL